VFKPVYDAPLAFPITFIIDPIFTFILLAGVVTALWKKKALYAAVSGFVLVAYLGLQLFAQQWAMDIGREYAASIQAGKSPVIAFPQPLSPFNWKVVVVESGTYHRAYVNLLEDEPRALAGKDDNLFTRIRSAYQPRGALKWKTYSRWPSDSHFQQVAFEAWSQDAFEGFREFALLPYVTSMRGDERDVCVWFTDLRFTLNGMQSPFEYAMCRGPGGNWSLEMDKDKQARESG
jgi:inner membrane protein